MSEFEHLSAASWVLGSAVDSKRRTRLLQSPPFECLVEELNRTFQIEHVQYQGAPGNQLGYRCVVSLRAPSEVLDRFFNSASGYRAQYLAHPNTGDKANRFVLDTLHTRVVHTITERDPGKAKREIAETSLTHAWAKVWLHQGLWLRQAKCEHRVLLVPTWQRELASGDKRRRKLVRWGALAPSQESRLLLKGGYVRDGTELEVGKLPFSRAQELHELGFT